MATEVVSPGDSCNRGVQFVANGQGMHILFHEVFRIQAVQDDDDHARDKSC